ncbi:MAG: DUF6605 domain-containing protein [Pirellulaceae bacterium]
MYRIGYYGKTVRKVATIPSTQTVQTVQPAPLVDASLGLVDAGNWSVSAAWAVPATATSGVYVAKVTREDTGGASHIIFVVRDDDGQSDLLFQTSDTTWQAYHRWGGNSFYVGPLAGRAYALSYNRPFDTRATTAKDWFFSTEYPTIMWLEQNGYDVSYSTGVDSDRRGAEILEHRAFLSVGHDEYWSQPTISMKALEQWSKTILETTTTAPSRGRFLRQGSRAQPCSSMASMTSFRLRIPIHSTCQTGCLSKLGFVRRICKDRQLSS